MPMLTAAGTFDVLCAMPCLLLLVAVTLPASASAWLRSRLRQRLTAAVMQQLPAVLWLQQALRCGAMDAVTVATEATVSLHFFVAGLPCLYFLGFGADAMKMCAGLAFVTYLTSALKDLLCSPRPLHVATPAQRRQLLPSAGDPGRSFTEYGAPSLHTSAGLFAALALVHTLLQNGVLPSSPAAVLVAYLAALGWGVWIALTRMYLGVHSPLDLGLGGFVGGAVFGLWWASAEHHHGFVTGGSSCSGSCSGGGGPLDGPGGGVVAAPSFSTPPSLLLRGAAVVAAHAAALLRYPRPLHHTESFEYATTFVGAWGGFPVFHGSGAGLSRAAVAAASVSGRQGNPFTTGGEDAAPSATAWLFDGILILPASVVSALSPLARRLLHVAVGSGLVLLTRVLAKAMLTPFVLGLLRLLPGWARRRLQPPVAHKTLGLAVTTVNNEDETLSEGQLLPEGRTTGTGVSSGKPASGPHGLRRPEEGGSRGSVGATAGLVQHSRNQQGAGDSSTLGGRDGTRSRRLAVRRPGGCSGGSEVGAAAQGGTAARQLHGGRASGDVGKGGGTEGSTEGAVPRSGHTDREISGDDLAKTGPVRDGIAACKVAVSGPDAGLALRPDGYPCDADAVRRYLCYCLVVVVVVAYHEAATSLGLV